MDDEKTTKILEVYNDNTGCHVSRWCAACDNHHHHLSCSMMTLEVIVLEGASISEKDSTQNITKNIVNRTQILILILT
jgi:hypothetical protein